MSTIKISDFYYGAVLSMLFSHNIKPALIETGTDRQVYDFTTNNSEFKLFVKYRAKKQVTKSDNYNSWVFSIKDDIDELNEYIHNGYKLILALVCGSEDLKESQLAILDGYDLTRLMMLGKTSITISRKKGEKFFRISNGGKRENAIQIKCNRFEELF